MYKLTDLIKWGLAEAKIYLETGVKIQDLEEQLLLRGEFDEFETLKNLRRPELIEVANSWPGPRTKYCVEDIIKDIETRKPKRRYVVRVDKSRSYINYNEAELSIIEEKDGEWAQVPSAMPGFLVANNKTELTLDEEIKRTVKYFEKKCLPDLFEKAFTQNEYAFTSFRINKIKRATDKTVAEIAVEIQKKPVTAYQSAHEYWKKALAPLILDGNAAPANKKLALIGFLRDLSNTYERVGNINLKRVQNTMYALNNMLDKAMNEPEKYGLKENTSSTEMPRSKIEAKDKEISKANKIYAKGLIEAIVTNHLTIAAMHDHEIALNFRNGEPFKVKVETEIEYGKS